MQCYKYRSAWILLHSAIHFIRNICWGCWLLYIVNFWFSYQNQASINVRIYVWIFNSFLLSALMLMPQRFYYYVFLFFLKLGMNGKISSSSFIFQDCFNYCRIFAFPYKVDNCPFKFCKEWCWDFDGDFIGYVDYLC